MKKNLLLFLLLYFSNTDIVLAIPPIPPIPEIPPFPAVIANGKTYHVDIDIGRDNLNDGSSEKPWATLQYGIDRLSAGDTLIVHESVNGYNEFVNISSAGNRNGWITIKGAEMKMLS